MVAEFHQELHEPVLSKEKREREHEAVCGNGNEGFYDITRSESRVQRDKSSSEKCSLEEECPFPADRWKRTFLLKRALFRGALVPLHATFGPRNVVKSLIAVPTYSLMLPFALLFGQHWFMKFLVKLCDHLGMLFALVGIRPMRQPYVTE